MAFIARLLLPSTDIPDLEALLQDVEEQLDVDLVLDEETLDVQTAPESQSSWCPWPKPQLSVYVEGASTRGVDLSAEPSAGGVDVRVTVPVLATWTDWELGVRLMSRLARDRVEAVRVDGVGQFAPAGLEQLFLDQEQFYLEELEEGWSAIGAAIAQGRRVRIGGPAGYASVGAHTWRRLRDEADKLDEDVDLALRLVTLIQASIEMQGFDDFAEANPMILEGPGQRSLVAALLSPGKDLILRDPEYVLLSTDLETEQHAELLLLPFERLEEAFPALATWLDDRCCAVPAIPKDSWSDHIERIRPLLISVPDLLDIEPEEEEPGLESIPFPSFRTKAPQEDAPKRKWWKLW